MVILRDVPTAQTRTLPKGRLTETDLEEIERMARENAGEPYRRPLLALVEEVRRLKAVVLGREVTSGS